MKRRFNTVLYFLIIIIVYVLPSIIFPMDMTIFKGIKGQEFFPNYYPFYISYFICILFIAFYYILINAKHNLNKANLNLACIHGLFNFFYFKFLFQDGNLLLSFILIGSCFIIFFLVFVDYLKDRRLSSLATAYLIWSLYLTVVHGYLYYIN